MSDPSSRDQELKQRELDLKEREMNLRMRELEAELEAQRKMVNEHSDPESATVPQEVDTEALAHQRKLRKIILFGKLTLLATGVAVIVVVLNVFLFPIIVIFALSALLYGAYALFIKEKRTTKE